MQTYDLGPVAVTCAGAWDPDEDYAPLQLVSHRGGSWLCRAACFGAEPGVSPGWQNWWQLACDGIAAITRSGDKLRITYTSGRVAEL